MSRQDRALTAVKTSPSGKDSNLPLHWSARGSWKGRATTAHAAKLPAHHGVCTKDRRPEEGEQHAWMCANGAGTIVPEGGHSIGISQSIHSRKRPNQWLSTLQV